MTARQLLARPVRRSWWQPPGRRKRLLRPVRLIRVSISEDLTQANS